jgi:membrane protein
MREKRNRLKGFAQRLYITFDAFMANDLFTYAAAGAYSFFLSAFPLMLMILVILIKLVSMSPRVISGLLGSTVILGGTFDLAPFIHAIRSIKTIGVFEILVGVSVFWMARRFFASIQQGMTIIYRSRVKARPIKENLVVLGGELVLIFLIVAAVIAIFGGNAFFSSQGTRMSKAQYQAIRGVFRFAPAVIIFLFLFFVYYISPRKRPTFAQSFFASAACTVSFAVVHIAFTSFVNMSRYNLVYGVLSNIIVILLEVYLFFFLFLFFAQFQYVEQFFDSFLLAQIYLMPDYRDPDPIKQLERIMFLEPPRFYREYAVRMEKNAGIFRLGDDSTELYYIWKGFVRLDMPNQVIELGRGRIFGEFSSIAGGMRTATATAETDVILLKLPARLFRETVEVDADLSRRTLQMISDYVRKKNNVPLSPDE